MDSRYRSATNAFLPSRSRARVPILRIQHAGLQFHADTGRSRRRSHNRTDAVNGDRADYGKGALFRCSTHRAPYSQTALVVGGDMNEHRQRKSVRITRNGLISIVVAACTVGMAAASWPPEGP